MKKLIAVLAVAAVFVVACAKDDLPIDRLVTDKVIDMAVASLADDIVGQHGYSYTRAKGITWTAGVKARHAVFQDQMGPRWRNEDWSDELYQQIIKIMREGLDTPEELWVAYARHKSTALDCVRQNGVEKQVAEQIAQVLPYFNGTAPDSTEVFLKQCHEASASYLGWEMAWKEMQARGLAHSDLRAWEFAERRRAEGGDCLVDAWGQMLTDFYCHLASCGVELVESEKI